MANQGLDDMYNVNVNVNLVVEYLSCGCCKDSGLRDLYFIIQLLWVKLKAVSCL